MSPDASQRTPDPAAEKKPAGSSGGQWISIADSDGPARRPRTVTASVLLLVATAVVAVALSQWFVGAGEDPRDSLGSRAAGFGFSDEARSTLFSALPLALPFLAVLLAPRAPFRQFASILYFVTIGIGACLATTAAVYGWNQTLQQHVFGSVWLQQHDVLQRAAVDGAWLIAFVVALVWTRRIGSPKPLPHKGHNKKFWTKLLPAVLTVRYRLISKRY